MKRTFCLCLFLLATWAQAQPAPAEKPAPRAPGQSTPDKKSPGDAGQAETLSIEILWAGVVSDAGDDAKAKPKETDQVPARKGVEFGVLYMLRGVPEGSKVTLRQVATYPAPGRRNSTTRKLQKTEEGDTECVAGETCATSYLIETADEIVPGQWRLELRYRGRKVMEKVFVMRFEGV
jgi:hypothetical protein